jgi:hypothetical protein
MRNQPHRAVAVDARMEPLMLTTLIMPPLQTAGRDR